MYEIRNVSGTDIPVAGNILKAGQTMKLDVSFQVIKNAVKNGFIVYREVKPTVVEQALQSEHTTNEKDARDHEHHKKRSKKKVSDKSLMESE